MSAETPDDKDGKPRDPQNPAEPAAPATKFSRFGAPPSPPATPVPAAAPAAPAVTPALTSPAAPAADATSVPMRRPPSAEPPTRQVAAEPAAPPESPAATGATAQADTAPPPAPVVEKITYDVAIIGGGFSGNAVFANMVQLADRPMKIAILSRDDEGVFGPAYATHRPEHLLNVRAGSMGLFASNFNHFYQWATKHDIADVTPSAYLPRMVYSQYIQSVLDDTKIMAEKKDIRCDFFKTEVEKVETGTGVGYSYEGFRLQTTPMGEITAKTVVLAVGNGMGHALKNQENLPGLVTEPWLFNYDKLGPEPVPLTPEELAAEAEEARLEAEAAAAAALIEQGRAAKAAKPTILVRLLGKKQPPPPPVTEAPPPLPEPELPAEPPPPPEPWREYHSLAVIGSGLTAIDTIVSILVSGWSGKIVCYSSSGLLPQAHLENYDANQIVKMPANTFIGNTLSQNLRLLRRRVKSQGVRWHYVVDGLRPVTQAVWQEMEPGDKRRMAGKYFTLWNIFRHRFAPQIGKIIDAAIAEDRLEIITARVRHMHMAGGQIALDIRPRGQSGTVSHHYDLAFQCTGVNYRLDGNPLLKSMVDAKLLRPDPNGMGILVQSDLAAHRSDAGVIYAMGSPLFGQLFETLAVPELRVQADAIAHYIVQSNS